MPDPAQPIPSDEEDPNEVELAWAEEIERRAERVRAGDAERRPWSEVRQRLLDRIRRD